MRLNHILHASVQEGASGERQHTYDLGNDARWACGGGRLVGGQDEPEGVTRIKERTPRAIVETKLAYHGARPRKAPQPAVVYQERPGEVASKRAK